MIILKEEPVDKSMIVREMRKSDTEEVFIMMRAFYDSPALIHKSSDKVLRKDIEDCLSDMPFVEGFILEENGEIAGYSMIAKSYTTEYGGICIWVEDIYIKEEYRGRGYATELFAFYEKRYKTAVRFRLEVEEENIHAIKSYRKNGYEISGYEVMTKEIFKDL